MPEYLLKYYYTCSVEHLPCAADGGILFTEVSKASKTICHCCEKKWYMGKMNKWNKWIKRWVWHYEYHHTIKQENEPEVENASPLLIEINFSEVFHHWGTKYIWLHISDGSLGNSWNWLMCPGNYSYGLSFQLIRIIKITKRNFKL